MLNTLLFAIMSLYAVICIGGILLDRKLYARLQRYHPEVWEQLDSPTVWPNSSFRSVQTVHRFVHRGEYRELYDPELNRLAMTARYVDFLAYGLFAIGVLLLFFGKRLGL